MRYAVVKLDDQQFHQYMRSTAPGSFMVVSTEAVETLLDPDDLRAINLWEQAGDLTSELNKETADRKARELRDGDRR